MGYVISFIFHIIKAVFYVVQMGLNVNMSLDDHKLLILFPLWEEKYQLKTPKQSIQNRGDLFVPEGQKTQNNRQRQEIDDNKEEAVFVQAGRGKHRGQSLDREETDVAYRQMVVYYGKMGNSVLGCVA